MRKLIVFFWYKRKLIVMIKIYAILLLISLVLFLMVISLILLVVNFYVRNYYLMLSNLIKKMVSCQKII